MTPLALAVCLLAMPAERPGAGLPLSGFHGTTAAAVAPTGSKLSRGGKPLSRPRSDAYAPGLPAADGPVAHRVLPPFRPDTAAAFPDTLEVAFFANTRPVRVRVTIRLDGKPLAAAWDTHLRKLFAAFDRDGDGTLNRFECDHIFSARGLGGLLAGAHYYRSPTAPPTFEQLDRDIDNRVAYPEFAAYYAESAPDFVRPRHVPVVNANADQLTRELFAKLDLNKDGKLSRDEVRKAESIIGTNDKDDDECLSPIEIFPDLYENNPRRVAVAATPAMAGPAPPPKASPPDLHVHRGPLPGVITQHLIKRYDKNADFHLTRAEIGFTDADFVALDTNRDGKLAAAEIEAWRTGPPEFTAELNLARSATNSSVTIVPRTGSPPTDLEIRPGLVGRAVVRVGKQFLDLSATPASITGQRNRDAQQLVTAFPQGKQSISDDEIAGPQFQFLRIVFDAADFDGNGRLTRDEFRKYLDLQQSTIDIALSLTFATRTPSLFQLMDENNDGRLGVRELRTAWDRLIVLEPAGGDEVTTAAIQPSAGIRLAHTAFLGDPSGFNGNPFVRDGPKPTRGPLWFIKMDRNGDGDVSSAEFLGPADDFAAMDTNGDGLLETAEAEAYDKKTRKSEEKPKK